MCQSRAYMQDSNKVTNARADAIAPVCFTISPHDADYKRRHEVFFRMHFCWGDKNIKSGQLDLVARRVNEYELIVPEAFLVDMNAELFVPEAVIKDRYK